MTMREIALLKGRDLDGFLEVIAYMAERRDRTGSLRVCVDDGTLKLKVDQGTWSPPMGGMDPECQAAFPEPTWIRDPKRCANGWHQTAPARMLQSCPECPTTEGVDPRAYGYRPAEEGPTDWVQRGQARGTFPAPGMGQERTQDLAYPADAIAVVTGQEGEDLGDMIQRISTVGDPDGRPGY